jgi:(p)ppGpp synthase/HD superfamily hydrolase
MQPKFTGLFEKALEFAIKHHKGQYRKGSNMPYIWHPMCVAKNVEFFKKSKNLELLLVCALLHDTYEDCEDVTLELIAKEFGYKVAAIVEELSSDPEQIKLMGKTEYLKQKMLHMSSYALVIKLSDRLDNVKDLEDNKPEFREKYSKETLEIISYLNWKRKLTITHKKLIEAIETILIKLKEESV